MRRVLVPVLCAALLTGCARDAGLATPPAPKPAQVGVKVLDRSGVAPKLRNANVSTKSGDLLIMEMDGGVYQVSMDSPEGKQAFQITQDELAALTADLGIDLTQSDLSGFDVVTAVAPRRQTAQERALAEFAARTRPAFPRFAKGFRPDPRDFRGAMVTGLSGDRRGDLIEVRAEVKPGVDAEVAFAYATCALAGWAKKTGKSYARHIRTMQSRQGDRLTVGSVFTLSDHKPMGLRVMETNETLQECRGRGIPAV